MSPDTEPLALAITEIERHASDQGWDQPPRLYALAHTRDVARREPALAERLGVEDPESIAANALTPIEQEVSDKSLEDLLTSISWPETVVGCALVVERIVLPPMAEEGMPDDPDDAVDWAQNHPRRTDVRIVAGAMRDGTRRSLMRIRGHEADEDLIREPEFSPDLAAALAQTFAD